METLLRDFKLTLRTLAKKPTFAAIAMLSLALGIGANTTVFTIANELFLRPLPVEDADRLVAIQTRDEKMAGSNPVSHLNWLDIREQNKVFDQVFAHDWVPLSVSTGGEADVIFGQMVSGNYFDALGVTAAHGRTFLPAEDATPGTHPVAVLSHRFWSERLGSDPTKVGQTLLVNSQPFTIVGVAPASFGGVTLGVEPELWVPMMMNKVLRREADLNWYDTRRGLFLFAYARLAPGVSHAQAASNLEVIGSRLREEYPDDNQGRSFGIEPLASAVIPGGLREGLTAATSMLMVIVGLVLLIACANIANLLLARATERRREVAVRLAIGAERGHLIRQLLTESIVVSVAGGALGLLVAIWARSVLLSYLPSLPLPVTVNLSLGLDPRVLLFTLALSVATGLIFGLAPALQSSKPELVGSLKDGGDASFGLGRRLTARNLLVIAQVALCLVALAGAGLFLRSLAAAQRSDPGFETKDLASIAFDIGLQGYDEQGGQQFLERVRREVGALPGVENVALAQAGPMQGTFMRSVLMEGAESNEDRTLVQVNRVDGPYFETLGIPVLRGRRFLDSDRLGSVPVVIVNETMAGRYWPGEEAIGRRFRFFGEDSPVEVIGVARDAKYQAIGEDPQPYIYQPAAQAYSAAMAAGWNPVVSRFKVR